MRGAAAWCCATLWLCGWAAAAQAQEAQIGLLVPLTGPQKRLGEAVLDAVNFARVERGGPEIVVVDTGGTERGAVEGVERLAADPRVVAALGPVGWKGARAGALRAQALGLPMISLSAEEGIERAGHFVLRGRPSIQAQARKIAQVAREELQLESVAILYPEDELGRLAAEAFFEESRRLGARVTAMEPYEPGATNLTDPVEALVGKRMRRLEGKNKGRPPRSSLRRVDKVSRVDFEGIFVPDYDEGAALTAKFLRFHDVPLSGIGDGGAVQVLGVGLLPGARLRDAEGLLAGALYTELFHAELAGEASRAFSARFEEAFGRAPSDMEAQVYDLYAVLQEALASGEPRAEVTREALPGRLLGMAPRLGVTGLRWFLPDGAPGLSLEIWAVGAEGEVGPSF
jgi:branched-chain amino acid transport system substrate-binding protein